MLAKASICSSQNEHSQKQKSMKLSGSNFHQHKPSKLVKAFQKTQIQIKNQLLNDLLQVYSWRSKTQLPIAKVMFYKVISRIPQESFSTVQVSYESFPLTLADLKQISIQNILYLLKQSIIGFQRLFSVFGSFLISNKMIALNKNNRCKVWINQNFSINEPIAVEMFKNLTQKTFIDQILTLFEKKCTRAKNSQVLFSQLVHCQKFEEIVIKIEDFAKNHRIQILTSYKPEEKPTRKMQVSKSPLRNPNQMTTTSFIATKERQVPKFLNKSILNHKTALKQSDLEVQRHKQKSRSVSRNHMRSRTPINRNRNQLTVKNPLKFFMKNSGGSYISKEEKQKRNNDYSFQLKKHASGPGQEKNNKLMASSNNIFSQNEIKQFNEQTSANHKNTKTSDLNTSHTNDSIITNKKFLHKKMSLFEEDRDMLQSIVQGQKQIRKSLYSTFDLQKLGKLGKNVGESCMPNDFENAAIKEY